MGVTVHHPSNDNFLMDVRALDAEDIRFIVRENALVVAGEIVRLLLTCPQLLFSPTKVLGKALAQTETVQIQIVARGSSLEDHELYKIRESGTLVCACAEVIQETRNWYLPGELQTIIFECLCDLMTGSGYGA